MEKRRNGLTKKKDQEKKCSYYLYRNYIIIVLGGQWTSMSNGPASPLPSLLASSSSSLLSCSFSWPSSFLLLSSSSSSSSMLLSSSSSSWQSALRPPHGQYKTLLHASGCPLPQRPSGWEMTRAVNGEDRCGRGRNIALTVLPSKSSLTHFKMDRRTKRMSEENSWRLWKRYSGDAHALISAKI